jgi:hypothetical protein
LRTARQQLTRQRLEVRHRYGRDRQAQQARAASGNQNEQQVVGGELLCTMQDLLRRTLAGLVRHRMTGLDDADPLRRQPVRIARDDDAFHWHAGPGPLDGKRHARRRLARADDYDIAAWRRRQVSAEHL